MRSSRRKSTGLGFSSATPPSRPPVDDRDQLARPACAEAGGDNGEIGCSDAEFTEVLGDPEPKHPISTQATPDAKQTATDERAFCTQVPCQLIRPTAGRIAYEPRQRLKRACPTIEPLSPCGRLNTGHKCEWPA